MRKWIGSIAVGLALLAAPALAQEACKGVGEPRAGVIPAPPKPDENQTFQGVMTRALSADSFAKFNRTISCTRGEPITAGGRTITLTGSDGEPLPRRAVGATEDDPSFYLTSDIDPAQIISGALSGSKTITITPRYILVRADKAGRSVVAVYNAVPGDAELRRVIGENAAAATMVQARVDAAGGNFQITSPEAGQFGGAATPQTQAQLAQAQAAGVRRSNQPDGTVWVDDGRGGATHRGTRFDCQASWQSINRTGLIIFDASDNGRDVGCNYGLIGSSSWYSIFLTKIPGMTLDQYFQLSIRDAQTSNKPAHDTPPPLAPGNMPAPTRASFWLDTSGTIQGIWGAKTGDWFFILRASLQPGKEAEAADMAREVFRSFYSEVGTATASR